MCREEVSRGSKYGHKYDYDQRLANAKDYFVFYYSNHSNHVVTGMSRIKKLGELRFHEPFPPTSLG
jgi:exodeoxyribonuclease V alpha subunit